MNADSRGISPVIGVILLVAVVVILAAVSGAMFLSLSEEQESAPNAALSMESGDGPAAHVIKHEGGDELDGGHVELRGTTDSEALSGSALSAGDGERIHATDETIEVVWKGDDGSSYVIRTFEVDSDETVPSSDESCSWVESESNDGTDSVKVDGVTVDCDVATDDHVKMQNGGIIIGEAVSDTDYVEAADSTVYGDTSAGSTVDGDNASFYGTVEGGGVVNIQDGEVTGSVTSESADVKLGNTSVEGSVDAAKVAELTSGSSASGDVVGDGLAKVLNSEVSGSVVSTDSVKLDGATVEGDVYVDPSNFDCTDSTINGQNCDDYSPKDPADY